MKKNILLVLFAACYGNANAQTIPNGNFELWGGDSFETVKFYSFNSNPDATQFGYPMNCEKSADAYHGSSAIKLTTVEFDGEPMLGFFLSAFPQSEDPSEWTGGMAYDQKPTGIRGYYKSDIPVGDTAMVIASFSKNGVNVGSYVVKLVGEHTSYTLFDLVFSPALSVTPDAVFLGATSSNFYSEDIIIGSMLLLDSLSFTGVASQPAELNGDFEEWDMQRNGLPEQWHSVSGLGSDVERTSDAYQGSSAVRIGSSVFDWDGQLRAITGSIGTGFFEPNCSPCDLMGGHPFSNTYDTLVFFYKYTASAGSKGSGYYMLKAAGDVVAFEDFQIEPSATFRKMEVPIMSFQTPDTLVVDFQSLRWTDSLPAHGMAVLTIDEVHLKSQPLSIGRLKARQMNELSIYPNPASNQVNIRMENVDHYINPRLRLVNAMGQTVYTGEISDRLSTISVNGWPAGAYFFLLESGGEVVKSGKLIVQ